ncbi:amidase [Streptomyces sp. NPDC048590]|uniref:amidase n=1 Tax=Streptomyces sp. NPDC048590 TaxID=3365574 RepID=UPI00371B68A5
MPSAPRRTSADSPTTSLGRRRFLSASGALGAGAALGGAAPASAVAGTGRRPVRPDEIVTLEARHLASAVKLRQVSCEEVMEAYLRHIEEFNPKVNAVVGMRDPEACLDEARERDRDLRRGRYLGWMHGLPHAVKDLSPAKGLPWTEGSPVHRHRIASTDALFVQRIKRSGAVVIGKTNTPEFGLGSQTYNSVWGTTGNAYDPSLTAGGSSGGAASAVALRMLPVADGSDYMGSLRNPAAFNGVVGFRPSAGRVPNPGYVAQLGTAGPMGRTVADVAALLSVMAGPDPSAPLGIDEDPEVFAASLKRDFRGTRIAWVGDWNGHLAFEPGVLDVCRRSFAAFESLGCTVDEAVPDMPPEEVWSTFLAWRWWNNLGLHDLYADPGTRSRMKPEAVWEVEHGVGLSALDISRAVAARDRFHQSLRRLFDTYDYVLAPTTQVFPYDKEVHWPASVGGRRMDTYHRWMETVAPWSLSGLPVAAVPAGLDAAGLPTGVQLIGKDRADLAVLQLAHAYEGAAAWASTTPPLLGRGQG